MTVLVDHLRDMAGNNAWANHRLHTACERLTAEELSAPRTGFFGSILATLNHILVVDWYYLDALEDGGKGPALYADAAPFARFEELHAVQHDADRRLVAYCDRLTDAETEDRVTLVREGEVRHRERVADVLAHLFQHQIHHRGQVHAMLSSTRVAPPQLDEYFLREDAARRAADLRALGLPPR